MLIIQRRVILGSWINEFLLNSCCIGAPIRGAGMDAVCSKKKKCIFFFWFTGFNSGGRSPFRPLFVVSRSCVLLGVIVRLLLVTEMEMKSKLVAELVISLQKVAVTAS